MGWITGAGNISYLQGADPAAAGHFFNTPNSFCTGGSLTRSPVPGGYATTPCLSVDSYTNSATATSGGNPDPGLWGDGTSGPGGGLLPTNAITPGVYKWIMYDIEGWAQTPAGERADPPTSMLAFTSACHASGYKSIMAPGYDLYSAAALANYPLTPSTETREHWFVRVIAGLGGAGCDMFLLQNESQQGSGAYATLWNDTVAMFTGTSTLVFAEVSSSDATGSTGPALGASMAADAQTLTSPYPDGFYVAMPLATGESPGGAHQAAGRYFLDDMMTAGYTPPL